MKFPDLAGLLHKKQTEKERLLSLIVGVEQVSAAVWSVGSHGPDIEGISHETVTSDTWEDRIQAADESIGKLDEKLSQVVHKVVLGLPVPYLTETGDILASVGPNIKKLTSELELEPIGFVSLSQAIIHKLKLEEGVPPSVILVGVTPGMLAVSLYKVGVLKGQMLVAGQDAQRLEETLKNFKEAEVLPSRMLLYGGYVKKVEEVRQVFLKHPWPTRVNFLHFPKIEQLSVDTPIMSVCLAGASELATEMGEEIEKVKDVTHGEAEPPSNVVAQKSVPQELQDNGVEEQKDEANVVMVDPETLGFSSRASAPASAPVAKQVASQTPENIEEIEEEMEEDQEPELKPKQRFVLPTFTFPKVPFSIPKFSAVTTKLPITAIIIDLVLSAFMSYWVLPHATVTIVQAPQPIEESATITVDPTATSVNSSSKTIPGTKLEHVLNGEKTIPVTGKKQVGDPAKGTVVVYNLSSTLKTFKVGTVLGASTVNFKLDNDISVASASINLAIGTATFGKGTVPVTATIIGPEGNLPAGTQFVFKDTPADTIMAKNDQSFSGGTSKDVTVVSRADYDALTKALTDELVQKAKNDLTGSIAGSEKLVDATIKASPTEKEFSEEIGQEATSLHGKLTVQVKGISYKDDDIIGLLKDDIASKVPSGFSFSPERSKVTVEKAQVKKDSSTVLSVRVHGEALPKINTAQIQAALVGKSVQSAQEYLRGVSGIGGVEFSLKGNIIKNKLPVNSKNILVKLATPE